MKKILFILVCAACAFNASAQRASSSSTTFFSTEKLPGFIGKFVSALPLSQTSHLIRSISAGEGFAFSGIVILLAYLLVFTAIASWFIYKKKNL